MGYFDDEVKAIGEGACSQPHHACMSLRVDEIEIDTMIKKDVVLMQCFKNNIMSCQSYYEDKNTAVLNDKMSEWIQASFPSTKVTAVGTKGAWMTCCSDDYCNTTSLKHFTKTIMKETK